MRIAQVAPLHERVPPKLYGGTERVVHTLTEELVRRGHEVTLFASGDSDTSAKLVSLCDEALRLNGCIVDPYPYTIYQMEVMLQQQSKFDVIHNHQDYFAYPFARRLKTAFVTTLHGRLDLPDLATIYGEYDDMALVSISDSQRKPLNGFGLDWRATVLHGIALENYTPKAEPGKYLAFLGRISPEKGPDIAIEIAKKVGMELRIAAKVDKADEAYFREVIEPKLDHPLIKFIGEVDEQGKNEFLRNAYAYLFPIRWPEPFGLTMVESMACGTPVIAANWGSVPEVMRDGVSGFICETVDDMIAALDRVHTLDRMAIRQYAERRFSPERMADDYEAVYEDLISETSAKRSVFVISKPAASSKQADVVILPDILVSLEKDGRIASEM